MGEPAARFGSVEVTADGEGLISHAGAALLVELADRVGLTGGCRMRWPGLGSVARRTIPVRGLIHELEAA